MGISQDRLLKLDGLHATTNIEAGATPLKPFKKNRRCLKRRN